MPYSTAEGVAAFTAAAFTLPDGATIERLDRGVYYERNLNGDCFTLFLVDSLGDRRGTAVRVHVTAPLEVHLAARAELWDLLDRVDPQPSGLPLRIIR